MCMCLLPEWNAFRPGVVMGCAGLIGIVIGIVGIILLLCLIPFIKGLK